MGAASRRPDPAGALRSFQAGRQARCYTGGRFQGRWRSDRMSVASTRMAVYPGTFDPITNGHVDLVNRAAPLFERLVVGVAESPGKKPALPLSLRVELARDALGSH